MICRLVIITIVTDKPSNDFIANYKLISACAMVALIHLIFKPYNSEILNSLDGIILKLIILVAALPLCDDFDSPLVTATIFLLIILYLLKFITITFCLNRHNLKKAVTYFMIKDELPNSNNTDISNN